MKEQIISEEGATFTSALRTIKSASSLRKHGVGNLKQSQSSLLRGSSFSNLMASSVRITERKNLTLAQLYGEYEHNPNTEYVLRLKNKVSYKQNASSTTFDSWIHAMNSECLYTEMPNRDCGKKQAQSNNLKRQIQLNILKIGERLRKKETQTTQQSFVEQVYPLSKQQTKYSFSNYFSECSQLQNKEGSSKPQIVTKVSLGSHEWAQNKAYQILPLNPKKQQIVLMNKKITFKNSKSNKQNIQLNLNNIPGQQSKVIGLEFSKKTRFKSTKRKRKG